MNEIVRNAFLIHEVEGGLRFSMDGVYGFNKKTRVTKGFEQGFPSSSFLMVKGKDHQTVIVKILVTLFPDFSETFFVITGRLATGWVFNDFLSFRVDFGGKINIGFRKNQPQPDVEEVS